MISRPRQPHVRQLTKVWISVVTQNPVFFGGQSAQNLPEPLCVWTCFAWFQDKSDRKGVLSEGLQDFVFDVQVGYFVIPKVGSIYKTKSPCKVGGVGHFQRGPTGGTN